MTTIEPGIAVMAWGAYYGWPVSVPGRSWINPVIGDPSSHTFPTVLGSPPAPTISVGQVLELVLVTFASTPGEITPVAPVSTVAGSPIVQVPSGQTAGMAIDQLMLGVPLSVGSGSIRSINGGLVTLSNPMPQTLVSADFMVLDYYPHGTLALSVAPTTGVSIADYDNFDGTSSMVPTGNGTVVSNYSGEGEGGFYVGFATAGTYTVTGAFTPGSSLFTSASVAPLTVNVQ